MIMIPIMIAFANVVWFCNHVLFRGHLILIWACCDVFHGRLKYLNGEDLHYLPEKFDEGQGLEDEIDD